MVRACEADNWFQREDHIHARGATSSAALSLDMLSGMSVPIGTNTVTAIALSPPARPYCQSVACEHRAAAMTSYVEASSGVVKESHSVFDLSQVATTPFSPVVNGCTCSGCNDLKAGVIYKMKCYNCVRNFQSTPKCLSFHQDTVSCYESCGALLCPKCHTGGALLGEHQQCDTCGQHTCHLCMNIMDYVNFWKCSVAICNVTLNNCIVGCENCEHHSCEECCVDDVGHCCECGYFLRCDQCKDQDCESCGVSGTYCIPDTLPKHSATQDELRLCENEYGRDHPWHGLDFDDDLMSEF
jgi:hypothetical protein